MCTHASVFVHACCYLPSTPCPTDSLARPGIGGGGGARDGDRDRGGRGVKGKGEREGMFGGSAVAHSRWGSDEGQNEVSITKGLSVFSCSSVFHLLTQLWLADWLTDLLASQACQNNNKSHFILLRLLVHMQWVWVAWSLELMSFVAPLFAQSFPVPVFFMLAFTAFTWLKIQITSNVLLSNMFKVFTGKRAFQFSRLLIVTIYVNNSWVTVILIRNWSNWQAAWTNI